MSRNDDGTTQAELLVQLAENGMRFVRDLRGDPYAIRGFPPYDAIPLAKSPEVRGLLAHWYREVHGSTVGLKSIDDAISQLIGKAYTGPKTAIHLRVAPYEQGFVLDLGREDGAAVVVQPEGWSIVPQSPVLFRRSDLTRGMQNPEHGGSLDLLRRHFRVASEDFELFHGYLVSVFFVDRPRPILLLMGGFGTGKSTAAKMISALVDPSEVPLHPPPKDIEAWILIGASARFVALDNLSDVPPWLSDTLCRATSGDALAKRALYTNSSLHVLKVLASVALTSIEPGALRGDFGDRVLQLVFERFPEGERREELEVLASLERDAPQILGAILDAACAVMRQGKSVKLRDTPRMADFAKILAAMDAEYGTKSFSRYIDKRKAFAIDVAFSDSIVAAVSNYLDARGPFDGTASQLLAALSPELSSIGNRRWTAPTLGKALQLAIDSFRAVGIAYSRDKTSDGKERRIHLYRFRRDAVCPVRPSDAPVTEHAASRPDCEQNAVSGSTDSTDSTDTYLPTLEGAARALEVIREYARPESILQEDLLAYFHKRAAISNEAQAHVELVEEIERRRRGFATR